MPSTRASTLLRTWSRRMRRARCRRTSHSSPVRRPRCAHSSIARRRSSQSSRRANAFSSRTRRGCTTRRRRLWRSATPPCAGFGWHSRFHAPHAQQCQLHRARTRTRRRASLPHRTPRTGRPPRRALSSRPRRPLRPWAWLDTTCAPDRSACITTTHHPFRLASHLRRRSVGHHHCPRPRQRAPAPHPRHCLLRRRGRSRVRAVEKHDGRS